MKKPILVLKTTADYCKFVLCLILCFSALYLLLAPSDAVTVFSKNRDGGLKSFYGLLGSYL